MADETNILDQLISRVPDESLRSHLAREVDLLRGSRHFGLVFDRHLPESVRLVDYPIRKGVRVSLRDESSTETWIVVGFADQDRKVAVLSGDGGERPVDDLAVVREFGEPIYPGLRSVERIPNGPEDAPWHVVINGENYHALQALRTTHREKIDLIYIDPPYNTGNDGWIYNDRYVDQADRAKSSKWLSFLERRLLIARDLLKPNGVICISIGYAEAHRLQLLAEQTFRAHNVQLVTLQTSEAVNPKAGFNFVHEHLVCITPTDFVPQQMTFTGNKPGAAWHAMNLAAFDKTQRPNQAFPIFIDEKTGAVHSTGPTLADLEKSGEYTGDRADYPYEMPAPEGTVAIWPITGKGDHCVWRLVPESFMANWDKGYIKVLRKKGKAAAIAPFGIQYLSEGEIAKVESGETEVLGHEPGVPTVILGANMVSGDKIPSMWNELTHRTTEGNSRLKRILGSKRFPYPKPVELIIDIVMGFSQGNRDAVILDFFGGSGTTVEAVMELNTFDGGNRQAILVTNNELSATEAKKLRKAGLHPGDAEWESKGVFEYVCRPRISTVLKGVRPDGSEYSDGLPANVEMFDLVYLDPSSARRGIEFPRLAPLFWLQGGARGERIEADPGEGWALTATYGVLFDIDTLVAFADAVTTAATTGEPPGVLFIVTDSLAEYQQAVERLPVGIDTVQLYEDYLLNCAVNFSGGIR